VHGCFLSGFVNAQRQNGVEGTVFQAGGQQVAIARNPEPTKPVDVLFKVAGRSVPDFIAPAPPNSSLFA